MHAVIDGQTPLVVILPTGGGKSLLFMVPAYLEATGVTVVVVPYRALADNLVDRIRRSGIDCFEWTHGQVNPATIVVVSADVAGSGGFLSYAELLTAKKLLRRVVVDECHLIFTSSNWRPKLAALRNLRMLTCPIVLLTATLPPALEQLLGDSMQIRCATYIRACTVRPNIRYMVSWCKRGEGEEMGLAMCRRRKLNRGEKGVVYCSSKAQCERLARELDCGYYHAEDVDRADRLAE
jgi:superfamily II DNA helicase RecQ